ncbi:MAG: hypothetical protein M0R41_14490 [Methylobacter tundripaludum]|nr:hypothetical protein [Methylobacter tundripaludum]
MKARLIMPLLLVCRAVSAEPSELPSVVDNSMYPEVEVGAAVKPSSANNALYEMMKQLEQLQVEVRQLTGKVEEQAFLLPR